MIHPLNPYPTQPWHRVAAACSCYCGRRHAGTAPAMGRGPRRPPCSTPSCSPGCSFICFICHLPRIALTPSPSHQTLSNFSWPPAARGLWSLAHLQEMCLRHASASATSPVAHTPAAVGSAASSSHDGLAMGGLKNLERAQTSPHPRHALRAQLCAPSAGSVWCSSSPSAWRGAFSQPTMPVRSPTSSPLLATPGS